MNMDKLMGTPTSVRVKEVTKETNRTVTLFFDVKDEVEIKPGQFLMVWVPTVDEIPMSISYWNLPTLGISVQEIGDATSALVNMKSGDWIGIRGPFGNSFALDSKNALVVGGGIGIAPLRPLVEDLLARNIEVTLLVAAKTKDELVLYNFSELKPSNFTLEIATDDGSAGHKGFATDATEKLLEEKTFDKIYTCGPELMMHGLYQIASKHGISIEVSMERYMKCGCGLCGTCALDPDGQLVCVEGPIFSENSLKSIKEFGQYHRDATGTKKKF